MKKFTSYIMLLLCSLLSFSAQAENVTITLVSDGSVFQTLTVEQGTTIDLGAYIPTIGTGCTDTWIFSGWTDDVPTPGDKTSPYGDVVSITALYDKTLYALWKKNVDENDGWKQITSSSELVDGCKYLIVGLCGSKYQAANKTVYATSNGYNKDLSVTTKTVTGTSPNQTIADLSENETWVLHKNGTTYQWEDPQSGKYLQITNWATSYKYLELTNTPTDFSLTFTSATDIRFYAKSGSYTRYLYWDNLGSSNQLTAYTAVGTYRTRLFKEVITTNTYWNAYPHCDPYTITLHAGSGIVEGLETKSITESAAGSGILLPTAVATCTMSGWEFAGWTDEGEITETDIEPTLIKAGTTYYPEQNNVQLYAVYKKITGEVFKQIKTTSALEDNGRYLIIHSAAQSTNNIYNNVSGASMYMAASKTTFAPITNSSALYAEGVALASDFTFGDPIYNPSNSVVWTLKQNGTTWNWFDATSGKYLQFTSNIKLELTDTPSNFTITVSDGKYTIKSGTPYFLFVNSAPYYLTYTSSGTTYLPHLYKGYETAIYSTNPNCKATTITLNATGGTCSQTEVTGYIGAPLTLPEASIPSCATGDTWVFAGWSKTPQNWKLDCFIDDLIPAGDYIPTAENETLYAVYKKYTDYYFTTQTLVAGEKYMIGDYIREDDDKDFRQFLMVTNDALDTARLQGQKFTGMRRNDNGGRTFLYVNPTKAEQQRAVWTLESKYVNTVQAYALKSVIDNKYLVMSGQSDATNNRGYMTTATAATNAWLLFERRLEVVDGVTKYQTEMRMYRYDGKYFEYFIADNMASSTYNNKGFLPVANTGRSAARTSSDQYFHYLYCQVKEFASYPPCSGYTVNFDPKEGTCATTSLTESAAYTGVVLPTAEVNAVCGVENWNFVGWGEDVIDAATGEQTFNLYLAGERYYPRDNDVTLYAVYGNMENRWERVQFDANIRLGGRYILAYCPDGETKKALLSTTTGTRKINDFKYNGEGSAQIATNPTITYLKGEWKTDDTSADEINDPDEKYIWEIVGTKDQYYFYNRTADKYLSVKEEYKATLTDTRLQDDADSLKFFMTSDDGLKGVVIASNVSAARDKRRLVRYVDGDDVYFYTNGMYVAKTNRAEEVVPDRDNLWLFRQVGTYYSQPVCQAEANVVKWLEDGVIIESYDLAGTPDVSSISGATVTSNSDGTYTIHYDITTNACKRLEFLWDDHEVKIRIPMYVDENTTMSEITTGRTDEECKVCDVYITENGNLTVNTTKTVNSVIVANKGQLQVASGNTLSAKNIIVQSEGDAATDMARINIAAGSTVSLTDNLVYQDRRLDESRWYWAAFPFDTKLTDVKYTATVTASSDKPTANTDYWVETYDGVQRAADSDAGKRITDSSVYWKPVASDATLKAGAGYLIGLRDNLHAGHQYHTLRFAMPVSDWTAEQQKEKIVEVQAAPVKASNPRKNNAGWNLIGNPFMNQITINSNNNSGLSLGEYEWDDEEKLWVLKSAGQDVAYYTYFDGTKYVQKQIKNATFSPFTPFFVQITEGNGIDFKANNWGKHSIVARNAEADEQTMVEVLLQKADDASEEVLDRFGIVIADAFTNDYEIGSDLQKLIGQQTAVWTRQGDLQLAYNALNEESAARTIPVGIRAEQTAEYQFVLNEEEDYSNVEAVLLTDYAEGIVVNLLQEPYPFVQKRVQQDESRFAITVALRRSPQVTTDLQLTGSTNGKPRKIVEQGRVLIEMTDGKRYDLVGTEVK